MSLTPSERETVINMADDTTDAHVFTYQRRVIASLKKNPVAQLIDEGIFEGTRWAYFFIPASMVTFRMPRQRRPNSGQFAREASDGRS